MLPLLKGSAGLGNSSAGGHFVPGGHTPETPPCKKCYGFLLLLAEKVARCLAMYAETDSKDAEIPAWQDGRGDERITQCRWLLCAPKKHPTKYATQQPAPSLPPPKKLTLPSLPSECLPLWS